MTSPTRLSILDQPAPRRRVSNTVFWGLCSLSLVLVVGPAVWVVWGVVSRAVGNWHWSVLTTGGEGANAGLTSEIAGTLLLLVGVTILAGVVGVLTGIYLAEYGENRVAPLLRGASEVLAGIPSIVLGLVGYVSLVLFFHWGFSLLAGLIVLSVMVVPYIAKTTEVALRQVPSSYREGADALGMSPMYAMRRITVKAALPGIATGMILALAIAVGETAPLLYTAGFSASTPKLQLTHSPVGYLTYAVWTFYNEPSRHAQQLAYDAALVLVVLVLALMVIARLIVAWTQRNSERAR
jgi:phosphate transport system permease protein